MLGLNGEKGVGDGVELGREGGGGGKRRENGGETKVADGGGGDGGWGRVGH